MTRVRATARTRPGRAATRVGGGRRECVRGRSHRPAVRRHHRRHDRRGREAPRRHLHGRGARTTGPVHRRAGRRGAPAPRRPARADAPAGDHLRSPAAGRVLRATGEPGRPLLRKPRSPAGQRSRHCVRLGPRAGPLDPHRTDHQPAPHRDLPGADRAAGAGPLLLHHRHRGPRAGAGRPSPTASWPAADTGASSTASRTGSRTASTRRGSPRPGARPPTGTRCPTGTPAL